MAGPRTQPSDLPPPPGGLQSEFNVNPAVQTMLGESQDEESESQEDQLINSVVPDVKVSDVSSPGEEEEITPSPEPGPRPFPDVEFLGDAFDKLDQARKGLLPPQPGDRSLSNILKGDKEISEFIKAYNERVDTKVPTSPEEVYETIRNGLVTRVMDEDVNFLDEADPTLRARFMFARDNLEVYKGLQRLKKDGLLDDVGIGEAGQIVIKKVNFADWVPYDMKEFSPRDFLDLPGDALNWLVSLRAEFRVVKATQKMTPLMQKFFRVLGLAGSGAAGEASQVLPNEILLKIATNKDFSTPREVLEEIAIAGMYNVFGEGVAKTMGFMAAFPENALDMYRHVRDVKSISESLGNAVKEIKDVYSRGFRSFDDDQVQKSSVELRERLLGRELPEGQFGPPDDPGGIGLLNAELQKGEMAAQSIREAVEASASIAAKLKGDSDLYFEAGGFLKDWRSRLIKQGAEFEPPITLSKEINLTPPGLRQAVGSRKQTLTNTIPGTQLRLGKNARETGFAYGEPKLSGTMQEEINLYNSIADSYQNRFEDTGEGGITITDMHRAIRLFSGRRFENKITSASTGQTKNLPPSERFHVREIFESLTKMRDSVYENLLGAVSASVDRGATDLGPSDKLMIDTVDNWRAIKAQTRKRMARVNELKKLMDPRSGSGAVQLFADNLVRKFDRSSWDSLVELFGKDHEIVKDVRSAWMMGVMRKHYDPVTHKLDVLKYSQEMSKFGKETINEILGSNTAFHRMQTFLGMLANPETLSGRKMSALQKRAANFIITHLVGSGLAQQALMVSNMRVIFGVDDTLANQLLKDVVPEIVDKAKNQMAPERIKNIFDHLEDFSMSLQREVREGVTKIPFLKPDGTKEMVNRWIPNLALKHMVLQLMTRDMSLGTYTGDANMLVKAFDKGTRASGKGIIEFLDSAHDYLLGLPEDDGLADMFSRPNVQGRIKGISIKDIDRAIKEGKDETRRIKLGIPKKKKKK